MKYASFVFLSLLVACGGSESSSSGNGNTQTANGTSPASGSANACESAGSAICARACACATDGKCRLGVGTDAGTASINFDDEQKCRDFYVTLGCIGGGEPGFDYGKCESAASAATCVKTAGGDGALTPEECRVSR